jgi:hypothetical protein
MIRERASLLHYTYFVLFFFSGALEPNPCKKRTRKGRKRESAAVGVLYTGLVAQSS